MPRLTRSQLHALAWQHPITNLAREFGLSDVALHKICRKHRVPTPPPGYWAKKAAGKPSKIVPLADPAETSEIIIRAGSTFYEPRAMGEARAAVLLALQTADSTASEPHSIIERTLARLLKAKPGKDGLVRSCAAVVIKIAVRPASIARVNEFLNVLVAEAARAGISLTRGVVAAVWEYDGGTISFELVEAVDKVVHAATEKELAAVAKWKREREERHRRYGYWDDWGEPKIPKWEDRYRGRLKLRLENVRLKTDSSPWGEPIRYAFAETKARRLEKSIPAILSTIAAMVSAKRSNEEFEERERQEAARRARHHAEEERKRIAEAQSIWLLNQLLEEKASADRLSALLETLMCERRGSRSVQFLEWAQARIDSMRRQLGGSALEDRLGAAGLFGPDEQNPAP